MCEGERRAFKLSGKNIGLEAVAAGRGFLLAFSPGTIEESELAEYAAWLAEDESEPYPAVAEEDSCVADSAARLEPITGAAEYVRFGEGGREFAAHLVQNGEVGDRLFVCLLYTSPSPRDQRGSRMPSSA